MSVVRSSSFRRASSSSDHADRAGEQSGRDDSDVVRDRLNGLWCDEDFLDWYPRHGRPSLSPAQLATVCVLQIRDHAPRSLTDNLVDHLADMPEPDRAGDQPRSSDQRSSVWSAGAARQPGSADTKAPQRSATARQGQSVSVPPDRPTVQLA